VWVQFRARIKDGGVSKKKGNTTEDTSRKGNNEKTILSIMKGKGGEELCPMKTLQWLRSSRKI